MLCSIFFVFFVISAGISVEISNDLDLNTLKLKKIDSKELDKIKDVQMETYEEVEQKRVNLRGLIEDVEEEILKSIENRIKEVNGLEDRLKLIEDSRNIIQLNQINENVTLSDLAKRMKLLVQCMNLPEPVIGKLDKIQVYGNAIVKTKSTFPFVTRMILATMNIERLLNKLEIEQITEFGEGKSDH